MKNISGIVFKTLREIKQPHMTYEALAEGLDLSSSCVFQLEHGNTKPSNKTILKYCFFYNIPELDFLHLLMIVKNLQLPEDEVKNRTQELYSKYNS